MPVALCGLILQRMQGADARCHHQPALPRWVQQDTNDVRKGCSMSCLMGCQHTCDGALKATIAMHACTQPTCTASLHERKLPSCSGCDDSCDDSYLTRHALQGCERSGSSGSAQGIKPALVRSGSSRSGRSSGRRVSFEDRPARPHLSPQLSTDVPTDSR